MNVATQPQEALRAAVIALPKAELHLHLEGSVTPETAAELAARQGLSVTPEEVARRYATTDFAGFLDAYRWLTTLLRGPEEYRQIAEDLFVRLRAQGVVYAEITVSAGVLLRRGQDLEGIMAALAEAAADAARQGLHVQWILDAVRQFGATAAVEVARRAVALRAAGVVAFGVGGDELGLPAEELAPACELARAGGLHVVLHAGEIGGPESVRQAVEWLGAERIGHGLAVLHDPALARQLADAGVPLEVCPTSNLRTGALARQLGRAADLAAHPLPQFYRAGLRLALGSDDPAMFGTDLVNEYLNAARLGLPPAALVRLAEMSFEAAFLPETVRRACCDRLAAAANSVGLVGL